MLTFRRIAAVMAPLDIAAGGFMMAAPAQAAPCSNSGYLCFWVNSGFSGEMGKVAGDNSNFANLPKNGVAPGTTSSALPTTTGTPTTWPCTRTPATAASPSACP